MPAIKLGNKHDCFSCGTKFYDLGKSEAVCPKCGANQKDAGQNDSAAVSQSSRRKRKADVVPKAVDLDEEDAPIEDIGDEELVGPVGIEDADLDEEEEEDFDDEA